MAEGSGKQSCSTEDQGTSPWTNNPLTTGLQGGPKCTVLGVIMSWVFPMDTSGSPKNQCQEHPSRRESRITYYQHSLFSTLWVYPDMPEKRSELLTTPKSHKTKVTYARTTHEGGGRNNTSLAHWERSIKHRRGKLCWELRDWLISRNATHLPSLPEFNWQL